MDFRELYFGKVCFIPQIRQSSIILKLRRHHFIHTSISDLSVKVGLSSYRDQKKRSSPHSREFSVLKNFYWLVPIQNNYYWYLSVVILKFLFSKVFLDHSLYFQIFWLYYIVFVDELLMLSIMSCVLTILVSTTIYLHIYIYFRNVVVEQQLIVSIHNTHTHDVTVLTTGARRSAYGNKLQRVLWYHQLILVFDGETTALVFTRFLFHGRHILKDQLAARSHLQARKNI